MEDFLNHTIAEVSKQRQVLEVECGLLKDLLKPWPRKKKVLEDSENKKIAATTQEAQNVSENLSNEEKQALSQVDILLRKAEKTRNLKSKVKQDVEDTTNIEACDIKKIDIKTSKKPVSSDSLVPKDSSNSSRASYLKESNHKAATPPSVPSLKTERSSKQTSEIQSSQPESRMMTRQLTSINKNSSATKEVSKDSRRKSNRPSSFCKPSSGKTRHVPAHMMAPFKTHENLKFPKQRKSHLPNHTSSARIATRTPTSMEVKTYKTLPDIASAESKRSDKSSELYINSLGYIDNSNIDSAKEISPASHLIGVKSDFSQEEELEDPEQISTENSNSNYNSTSNSKQTCDNCLNIDFHSVKTDQQPRTQQEDHSDLLESELQPFSLRKNGSSIKLPGKLMKLVVTNRSLRNRLSPSGIDKKVPTEDPAKQFVERLCSEEEISKELRMHTSALTCLKSHQILLSIVQSLHLDQLTENTSMETLYRAKRTLEFVLTTFAELQEEADYFSKVKYRQLPPVSDFSKLQNKDQEMSLWLDTGQQKGYDYDLWNHLQTSKRWAHLHFTEKYLQLNIILVKAAQAEWWKILTSQERNPTVLQGVFGLLTTHGQFLPALVENPDLT